DAPAVQHHGTGPTLAVIAALLAAGQTKMLAQCVEQGRPRCNTELSANAVDGEVDLDLGRQIAGVAVWTSLRHHNLRCFFIECRCIRPDNAARLTRSRLCVTISRIA